MSLQGPKLVDDPILRQQYFNNTHSGFLDVLGATFDETIHYNPTNAGFRLYDNFINKDNGRKLTKQEYLESKYYREGVTIGDDGIHESAAMSLAESYDERLKRRIVLNRARSSYSLMISQLGVGLVGSMLDPLNIAAGFIPVVGQARFASLAARFGKTQARLISGGAAGAVTAAVVEPLPLLAARVEQDKDYTLMDSLLNITFGTVIGGGLHAVGGAIADRISRASPQTREILTKTAVAQLAQGRKVDVDPIIKTDPTLRDGPPSLVGPVAGIREEFIIKAKGKRIPDVLRLALVPSEKPKTLLQFMRSKGGIWTQDKNIGDVKAVMDKAYKSIANTKRQDTIDKKGKRKPGGKTLDEMAELAAEAGYLDNVGEYGQNRGSINDLLDAMASDRFGNLIYSEADLPKVNEMQEAERLFEEAQSYGIEPYGYTDDEFFALLSERRSLYETKDRVPQNIQDGMTEEEFYNLREQELGKEYDLGDIEDAFVNPNTLNDLIGEYQDPDLVNIEKELKTLEEQIETLRMVDEVPQDFLDGIEEADELIERSKSFDAATEAAAVCIGDGLGRVR